MRFRVHVLLILLAVATAVGVLGQAAPTVALSEPGPSPSSTVASTVAPTPTDTSSTPGGFSINDELTPIPQGASVGTRFVVRTSTATPTEYMALRAALVRAGFVDSIEVSPGSFLVASGSMDADTARARIEVIPGVLEVLRTSPASLGSEPSSDFPAWWAASMVTLIAAAVLLAVSKSRPRPS